MTFVLFVLIFILFWFVNVRRSARRWCVMWQSLFTEPSFCVNTWQIHTTFSLENDCSRVALWSWCTNKDGWWLPSFTSNMSCVLWVIWFVNPKAQNMEKRIYSNRYNRYKPQNSQSWYCQCQFVFSKKLVILSLYIMSKLRFLQKNITHTLSSSSFKRLFLTFIFFSALSYFEYIAMVQIFNHSLYLVPGHSRTW